MTSYAALAYDAVFLAAGAIEASRDVTPESVRAGLLSLQEFNGVTATVRYEKTGDPVRSAVILRLEDDGTTRLERRIKP